MPGRGTLARGAVWLFALGWCSAVWAAEVRILAPSGPSSASCASSLPWAIILIQEGMMDAGDRCGLWSNVPSSRFEHAPATSTSELIGA